MSANTPSGLYPAVVTIQQLQTASFPLDSSVVFEAVQTSAGTTVSVQVPLTAIMTTAQGILPTGGGTGQILNKTSGGNYSTQWSDVTQFVGVGTGLVTSGSATSIVAAFAQQTALSVLGVAGNATLEPAAIVGAAAQVLRVNDAGNALTFGAINLGSSAAVTGTLPTLNGGTNNTTFTAFGSVYANGSTQLSATPAGTTGWPLVANGTAAAPSFQQLNLASGITGAVPVPNGGTNTSILTLNGVVFGNGTSTVGITAAGVTGSLLQANNGAPSFTTAATLATSLTVPTIFGAAGASAAIKLNATSVTIGTTGPSADALLTLTGNATGVPVALPASTYLHIIGADSVAPRITMDAFNTLGPVLGARTARGTAGGMSAVQTNDVLFIFGAFGAKNSTSYGSPSQINFLAAETFNATSNGQAITFATVALGSTNQAEGFRVAPSGGIACGTTADPGVGAAFMTGKPTVLSGTALSSTATAALLCGSIASFGLWVGTGVPAVNAGTGSLYLRNDGNTATSRMYVNINGTGTWTAVNTVA